MSQRIAVVGAGYFAQFHVQGWQAAGATVVALCDTDLSKARAMATRFGVAEVFNDAATMIEALSPDVVDVVLPPAAQAPVVRAALAKGIATVKNRSNGLARNVAAASRGRRPMVSKEACSGCTTKGSE